MAPPAQNHSPLARHARLHVHVLRLVEAAAPLTHFVGSRQEVQHQRGLTHVWQDRVMQHQQHLFIQVARQLEGTD